MLCDINQLPLQQFRKHLPEDRNGVLPPIELLMAPYEQILQIFQQCGLYHANCLPPEEQQRAQSFYLRADRKRFIAARLLLRSRLSQMALNLEAPITPAEWQLGIQSQGKPYLCGPKIKPSIPSTHSPKPLPHFNLSHSADYVAIAISKEAELGLDLEATNQRQPNISGISKMLFHAQEQQQLQQLLQQNRVAAHQRFFQLWCRYEALSKLEATGLLARPDNAKPYSHSEGSFSANCHNDTSANYYWALCWRRASPPDDPAYRKSLS